MNALCVLQVQLFVSKRVAASLWIDAVAITATAFWIANGRQRLFLSSMCAKGANLITLFASIPATIVLRRVIKFSKHAADMIAQSAFQSLHFD